jgi:hypothetical protein
MAIGIRELEEHFEKAQSFRAGEVSIRGEIRQAITVMGHYDLEGAGRLRANGVSRGAFVITLFGAGILLITIFCLQNFRAGAWEQEALRAHFQLTATQQALRDQQSINHNNQADFAACVATVDRYRNTLAQAQASAQQAAPTNPQAANMLRMIQLLAKLL